MKSTRKIKSTKKETADEKGRGILKVIIFLNVLNVFKRRIVFLKQKLEAAFDFLHITYERGIQ